MKKANPARKTSPAAKAPAAKATKTAAAKKPAVKKAAANKAAPAKKAPAKKAGPTAAQRLGIPATGTLAARIAAAKKIEAKDKPATVKPKAGVPLAAATSSSYPQRISGFPDTYIAQISVRLEDPDHPVTLTWTGPSAAAQETGPFRSSPGAGLHGLNCDSDTTSKRSGSTCTPKGTFPVTGFASQLSSSPEAKDVTWFVPARGIALHYYPSVPKYCASHGCVRLETRRIAQLIKNNSRVGHTNVVVAGTWTKPPHQW